MRNPETKTGRIMKSLAAFAGVGVVCGLAVGAFIIPGSAQEGTSAPDQAAAILDKTFAEIEGDPALLGAAMALGRDAFTKNCARCHGADARGAVGIPNLSDRDWLWGGDVDTIYETIRYGVRTEHFATRQAAMPSYVDSKLLDEEEARTLAQFILTLPDNPDYFSPAGKLFTKNCAGCHGPYGEGFAAFGAPRLNDGIWFYGGTEDDIYSQILNPKHGIMPAWEDKLPPEVIKALAIYVHDLGGGE